MKRFIIFYVCITLSLAFSGQAQENGDKEKKEKDPLSSSTFDSLKFRCIGPAVSSGRISDFAVNPDKPWQYYVAVASGNVWKTENGGITFKPIFEKEGSYSIGCVAMDPNNPYTIWVGTGENNSQRSVSYGDGIYVSHNGGKSWKNMGLKRSEHIGKIIVDPRNSQHVYVAVQGPLWGPGGDRGLYKTSDGGKNWKAILTISENTGVTDIVMDPRNPDVLYAASYQRRRHVWTLINGGPESAIYKSIDAGKTWDKLKSRLPKGDVGRIGLAISPADPDVLYAIIEAAGKASGVYRSTTRGASWEKRCNYISTSPQYYQELVCDPLDVDCVYSLDTYMMVSQDGGKTFKRVGNNGRHVDDHALWIDPENTDHLLVGGDGGIYESFDRGTKWDFKSNLPITQFYRVAVDNDAPFYNVYGGTQDNNTIGGPSRTLSRTGIVNSDWFITRGGDGFETQVDPQNPDIVYSQSQYGWLVRYDKKSGESMGIKPMEGKGEEPLRWNWDSPLLISPHSAQRLYFAANKLFRSDDRGNTWTAISPDLTRQIDRNKLPVMGKVWSVDAVSKNRSTSFYGNIVALSESPLQEGLLYVGTDDGLVQVTEDGGKNWRKIEKFPGIPEMTYVSFLFASPHNVGTIYAAFDNHKMADFAPYILKSNDRGKSWISIKGTLPENGPVYAIVEDHVNPDLLFAGTEFGVFFTIDGGKKWIQLKGNFPTIAVKDIAIQKRENDLVLATFGRSFYILDDYTPLRSLTRDILNQEAHMFSVKDALMYITTRTGTGSQGSSYYAAKNPLFGATFTYYLKDEIKTKKKIRREQEKELIKQGKPVPYPSFEQLREEDEEENPFLLFTIKDESGNVVRRIKKSAKKGMNRVTWDLRYPATTPTEIERPDARRSRSRSESGILALPGSYSVTMSKSVNGVLSQLTEPVTFNAVALGTTTLPAKDKAELLAFQKKVAELRRAVLGAIEATGEAQNRIKYITKTLKNTPEAPMSLIDDVKALERQSNEIMRVLTGDRTISSRNEPTPPAIRDRVQTIVWDQWRSTSAPTQTQRDAYRIAGEEFAPQLAQLKQLVEVDLKNIENKLEAAGAPWTPGRIPEWKME